MSILVVWLASALFMNFSVAVLVLILSGDFLLVFGGFLDEKMFNSWLKLVHVLGVLFEGFFGQFFLYKCRFFARSGLAPTLIT